MLFTTKNTSLLALIFAAAYILFSASEHFLVDGLVDSFAPGSPFPLARIIVGIAVFVVAYFAISGLKVSTDRTQAQFRDQDIVLQDLVDYLPLTITIIDKDGIVKFITDVNSGMLAEGNERRQFLNRPYKEYLDTFGEQTRKLADKFRLTEGKWLEMKLSDSKGEDVYMDLIGFTTKNQNRIHIIQNVTESRTLQKKISAQKELLEAVVDNLPQLIMLVDADGKVDFINRSFTRAFYELTGLDASAEARYQREHSMMVELCKNSRGISQEELTTFLDSTGTFKELQVTSRKGILHYFNWLRIALPDGNILSVGSDVTLQKKLMEDVDAQRALLQTLIENIPLRILFVDNSGLIQFINQNFRSVEAQRFIGHRMEDLFRVQLNNPKEQAKLLKVIRRNTEWTDVSLFMPTGEVQFDSWMRVPISGKGFIAIGQDITPRKMEEEEKNKLLDMLIKHNNDLDEFSYIASHNLRGPVASVLGLVGLFNYPHSNQDKEELVNNIGKSARKLDSVIRDLHFILEARHTEVPKNEFINMHRLVEGVKEALETQIHQSKAVITETISIETIYAIHANVYSILYNLVSNAIKFRRTDVRTEIVIAVHKAGDQVVMSVKDNGKGMNLDDLGDKLFMLYQRFDLEVEGKGLGLYMTKTQAGAMGGKMEVESTPNQGSTFSLLLPARKVLG